MVVTPSGNRLIVHFFTGILNHFPEVESFQVAQESREAILVRVVPTLGYSGSPPTGSSRRLRGRGRTSKSSWRPWRRSPPPPPASAVRDQPPPQGFLVPRLCILTQYFPPEMGAPQARLSELGERLIDLGWEVEALTALPNYPIGRVFPGYPRQPRSRAWGGSGRSGCRCCPRRRGFARRLGCYFSFAGSAAWSRSAALRPAGRALRRVAAALHRLRGPAAGAALALPLRAERERSLAAVGRSRWES